MNHLMWQFIMMPGLMLMVSCTAQFPDLASRMKFETQDCKRLCDQQTITSFEKKTADSLFTQGEIALGKGWREEAYDLLDQAYVYYYIALAKTGIAQKERQIAKEEQTLFRIRQDVAAYKQVLKELKPMEQQ